MSLIAILRAALAEPAAPSKRRVGLTDEGELVQLLAKPQTIECPHCGKEISPPMLKTRRRRLFAARNAAGAVMHLEIEP